MRPTYFAGSGGLVSTASDYLRFSIMLANHGELDGARILKPETVDLMMTNQLPGNSDLASLGSGVPTESRRRGIGFGLGLAVVTDPAATGLVTSQGECHWSGAASTYFFVNPKENLAAVFLTQLQPAGTYPIGAQMRSLVYSSITE
jgi:CubicO group peptidase (beta-lactamase class C family)